MTKTSGVSYNPNLDDSPGNHTDPSVEHNSLIHLEMDKQKRR